MINVILKNNKFLSDFFMFLTAVFFTVFPLCLSAQGSPPVWVNNLERAFPNREWIAVVAGGSSQSMAESAAMNAIARVFRTDVESLTNASQQFTQIVSNSENNGNISFQESKDFSQDVKTSANIKGLIGVQIESYTARDNTVYVSARMNRKESAGRYSGMVRENSNIINSLLTAAAPIGTFDAYSRLSFAYTLAQLTDNFQNILEVLDPSYANRRPAYGGAGAIRAEMLECASFITIGVIVNTENTADKNLLTRAAGSFFRDRGFKIYELRETTQGVQNRGDYVLRVNVRFEEISQNVLSSRYYIDAALDDRSGVSIFSFTEDDRRSHRNSLSEARRLAVRAAETSIKEEKFAKEFDLWINSFLE